jgi:murein DD-endopeptidase MepM/ murein hydrolase activator NlpD
MNERTNHQTTEHMEDEVTQPGKDATISQKANFWERWKQSLKDWHWYHQEHPERFTLNYHGKLRHFLNHVKRSYRRVKREKAAQAFPESDFPALQLILFFWGSLPRLGGLFTEKKLLHRRAAIRKGAARQHLAERIRVHPLAFLAGAMCIAAIAILISFYTLGTSAKYDGISLGAVSGFSVSRQVKELEQVTRSTLGDETYTIDRSLLETQTGLVLRARTESRADFSQRLSEQIGKVAYGYVLYVDGTPIAATRYSGALEELLEQQKKGYATENTVMCSFAESVEIKQAYVDASLMMNLGYVAEKLNASRQAEITYTVVAGDAWSMIAQAYGLTNDELLRTNPGYNVNNLHPGDVLTISAAVPYLTVTNVERQNYVQNIPYGVTYQDDSSMYQGDSRVVSAGIYGSADVIANVTYVNGAETQREVISSVTLTDPVAQVEARGTAVRPSWAPTGNFHWPCYGVITSYFGGRDTGISGASTYHQAIDIANGYGTAICASDGGTVVQAGWSSVGYGYLVVIDHGNGYRTYYAHNSDILVSVGEHVYQGQQISRMGSTGISSGNHCHFGILRNNTFVDPMNYLP